MIKLLLFLVCFLALQVCCREYILKQEKVKPFHYAGEMDDADLMRTMFLYSGTDVEIVDFSKKDLREANDESFFGSIPILTVLENGEKKFDIQYRQTAERFLAEELDLFPDADITKVEEILALEESMRSWYLFGDSIVNGHNRQMFFSNTIRDWVYSASTVLRMSFTEGPGPFLLGQDKISILDLYFEQLARKLREKRIGFQDPKIKELLTRIQTELEDKLAK